MQLSPQGKQRVEYALTNRAWTLEDLEKNSEFSIATVKKFSAGRDVSRTTFVKLCKVLEIDWEIASAPTVAPKSSQDRTTISSQPDKTTLSETLREFSSTPPQIDEDENNTSEAEKRKKTAEMVRNLPSTPIQIDEKQVQKIQKCCRNKIIDRHSHMRLLSGDVIRVDQLYVDVWLLVKPEHKHFNSPESLLKNFDIQKDRLALSKRIKRNSGFEVANENSKLVILGKPGSGKTTFLKHLAVDWCNDKFQPELIALLIELRQIRDERWNLRSAISQELTLEIKNELQILLLQGKLLILMDGLDEVPTNKLRLHVQEELHEFSKKYPKNRLILTCRTQIIASVPGNLTYVEVADFSQEQVKEFVQNWFNATGQSNLQAKEKWKIFNRAVASKAYLKELTATPILLSLMCWALQDEGDIPANRTQLYKKGIKFLLSRWNDEKHIEGWEVGTEIYRQLSIEDKEALLIEIAARKFENPENFVLFEQEQLSEQIASLLGLRNCREGVAVLKAIETQHGLLIDRADELWSFSHLTFQEHFTFQWLAQLPSKQLADKIVSWQWQGVVDRLVKAQQPADRLLRLIKQAIEQSIAREPVLQKFLKWLFQKSKPIQANYGPVAIRAFYYDITIIRNYNRNSTLDIALALAHSLHLDLVFTTNELTYEPALDDIHEIDLAVSLNSSIPTRNSTNWLFPPVRTPSPVLDSILNFSRTRHPDLRRDLLPLKEGLPTLNDSKSVEKWWRFHGLQWVERLRKITI